MGHVRDGTTDNIFSDMSVKLARHNLEVGLKRTREQCFEAAKKMALESAELARRVDGFVRRQYSNEPKRWPNGTNSCKGTSPRTKRLTSRDRLGSVALGTDVL